jgi:hypothetical protein
LLSLLVGLSFDGFHRRHLWKGDITPSGNPTERVFDTVEGFTPDRFAKPDGETFNLETTPAGGEEVTQFVDEDEKVQREQRFQNDDDDFQYRHAINVSPKGRDEYIGETVASNDGFRFLAQTKKGRVVRRGLLEFN